MLKKHSPVVGIVATAIGAALFFVLGKFVAIPTPIPNLTLNVQYAVLVVFAVLYGPIVAALAGFIGHLLIDVTAFGPWWSWILASAVVGLVIGLVAYKINVEESEFGKRGWLILSGAVLAANLVAWLGVAPLGDILLYAEPANKVFAQGAGAFVLNSLTGIVLGGALTAGYAATRTKSGSLRTERE